MMSLHLIYYLDSGHNVRHIMPVTQIIVWSVSLTLKDLTGPAGLVRTLMNCGRHLCELCQARIAAEADTLRTLVVQDFDGIAVEDGDHGAGEVSQCSRRVEHEQKKADGRVSHQGLTHAYFCFAIILYLIPSYVARGRIFFCTNSSFLAYGRPLIIFFE